MDQFFFAQKAFIVDAGKLLVVQKSQEDPHNPGRWEVPGGRMQFGEDVDVHLKREVKEEVGIEITPGPPFFIWQWQLERQVEGELVKMQIVAVARVCTPLSLKLDDSNRVDDDWLGEIRWVSINDLEFYDFIPNMLPVVQKFLEVHAK